MVKIEQIEEDQKLISKQKFSKCLKIIQNLSIHLPVIDGSHKNDIQQWIEDLHEILSNFYSGDEFPFNAIWELFHKLTQNISKYLISNGYINLITKILAILENWSKSMEKGKVTHI